MFITIIGIYFGIIFVQFLALSLFVDAFVDLLGEERKNTVRVLSILCVIIPGLFFIVLFGCLVVGAIWVMAEKGIDALRNPTKKDDYYY